MQQVSNSDRKKLPVILPWAVAAVALVLYLATLNHWLSLLNLVNVGKITGTIWQPDFANPLFAIVTFPFRLLPASLVPIILNLFAAVCAGLTLALLTRSVMILPADRTDAQRQRMQAGLPILWVPLGWLPPVLAAVICGLQLSFWEHATNASGQMFKLLIFAYIIRCLLEFRLDKKQSWLSRAALLYGAGMANNWSMIGYFPLFITALIWIKGLKFFNLGFLFRMAILGLAGLSVYFFIPLVQSFSRIAPVPFWEGLHGVLAGQKRMLFNFPRQTFLLLSLTSVLPLLIMSIRWSPNLGDTSPLGRTLARLIFHVVHMAFLVACLWVMFDPGFAPRQLDLAFRQAGQDVSFLTFYYLSALAVGYFSMYVLQVFGMRSRRDAIFRIPAWQKPVSILLRSAVIVLALFAVIGLPFKNIPEIRRTNGTELIQFASLLTENIPEKAVVIGDDLLHVQIAEAYLSRSGGDKGHMFVETRSLIFPEYHNFLHARYGTNWSEVQSQNASPLDANVELPRAMLQLSQTHPVYYLHPSFGSSFEFFYGVPQGLVTQMKFYPSGVILPPHLSDPEIAEIRAFWKKAESGIIQTVLHNIQPPDTKAKPSFRKLFMDKLQLVPEQDRTSKLLSFYFSRTLDYCGVEMQKAGQLEDANHYFTLALELHPANVVASINKEFNQNLRNGKNASVVSDKSLDDVFKGYGSWQQVVEFNGPVDEPNICLELGRVCWNGGLAHQAAIQLHRVIELVPNNLTARLLLAQLYVQTSKPDLALETINDIESNSQNYVLTSANRADLFAIKVSTQYLKNETDQADAVIKDALRRDPTDINLLNSILQVCLNYSRITNAVAAADAILRVNPDDTKTLDTKATQHLRLGQYDEAITLLNRSLSVDSNDYKARLLRGIAYLNTSKPDDAQRDFEILYAIFPTQIQVNFGLAEAALQKKDTNRAIQFYQACISNGGTNTPQGQISLQHLNELKGAIP